MKLALKAPVLFGAGSGIVLDDAFDYADLTALQAVWTASGSVTVPGDGTVTVADVGGTDGLISKLVSFKPGVAYDAWVDLVSADPGTNNNARIYIGTAPNDNTYAGTGFGDGATGFVKRLSGFMVPVTSAYVSLIAAGTNTSSTHNRILIQKA